jgi:adenosylhomocysteine nucleosidase
MMNDAPGGGCVVVTFALPDESRAFAKRLRNRQTMASPLARHLPIVQGEIGACQVALVHTGVGTGTGCQERLEFALQGAGGTLGHPRLLIGSGYAGALHPALAVGDLIVGRNFSDPVLAAEAGRLLAGRSWQQGNLTTQPRVAESADDKAALAAATGALAVDMETGWIAAACARAGVPMLSLRVISDAAQQGFPAPAEVLFNAARQRPRYVALPLWLLGHPARIPAFVRFVRGLGPAQENLARALEHLLVRLPLPLPVPPFSAINSFLP